MIRKALRHARRWVAHLRLPPAAKRERRRDLAGLPERDPGSEAVIRAGIQWLGRAQDCSKYRDGGVAHHYSLITGWSSSYPETTGYIVPTMLDYADRTGDDAVRQRARRMLDWLVSIQQPDGAFHGGLVDAQPRVPVVFNVGQILLGLASGVRLLGEQYRQPMLRAADWLVRIQDPDGGWSTFHSPFTLPGNRAYHTHVAWGLLEAARLAAEAPYAHAALANVHWCMQFQRDNGWFDYCCIQDFARPLTHVIGYTLRGLLEAYRFSPQPELLAAAGKMADGVLSALGRDGFLPGRLDADWRGADRWACLTGTSQIAHCWLLLYQIAGDPRYRDAAFVANRFVRRTIHVEGPEDQRGGVKGSLPISGGYCTYRFVNWACKFTIDANVMEQQVRGGGDSR